MTTTTEATTTTTTKKNSGGRRKKATTPEDVLRGRVLAVRDELASAFVGRDDVAHGIICAMLAQEHTLLIGPPGTGKSAMVRAVTGALDGATYWEYLLTRFTEPNEVLGPIDLNKWSATGDYERRTAGYLPTAHVGFADEIFKANSSILNALLGIANERVFHEAGSAVACPLRTLVGASNELPEGGTAGELSALYDRFLMRFDVQPPQGEEAFVAIVGNKDEAPTLTARITLADVDAATAHAAAVDVPEDTLRAMFATTLPLADAGILVSHRRWKKAAKILRAHAWLDGCTTVDPLHFEVLQHVLWDEPDQHATVKAIVGKVSAPKLADAVEIRDAAMELAEGLPATGQVSVEGQAVMRELTKAIEAVEKLLDSETSEAVARRIEKNLDELDAASVALEDRLKAELFSGSRRSRRSRTADGDES